MRNRLFVAAMLVAALAAQTGMKVTKKYSVPGDGTWDYITFDAAGGRLFVAHQTTVNVLDANTGKVLGEIPKTPGVHGVALVQEAGKGYISADGINSAIEFDLKTLKVVGHVPTGTKPDAIVYDDGSRRVLVSNGDSDDLTVIDPFLGRSVGPIALGGAPEFIAGDGKGTVWVNLEDKNETLMVDPRAMAVKKRFKLPGCDEPSSMAMDRDTRRLFIGCGNKKLLVLNADSGAVVTTFPIGDHVDATSFDPAQKLAFTSCGDGKLFVVHEESADKFTLADTITTQRGAKTHALDAAGERIFLSTVEGVPEKMTGPPSAKRGMYKPGPMVVLVVSK